MIYRLVPSVITAPFSLKMRTSSHSLAFIYISPGSSQPRKEKLQFYFIQ